MARLATCACEQLRATCEGEPSLVSLCHCSACQKRTGSAFGVAAFFDASSVRTEGARKCFTRPSDSGFSVRFYFCPECGSTVYWEPERKPGVIAVALGAFADPAFPAPSQAVYRERRHAWAGPSL